MMSTQQSIPMVAPAPITVDQEKKVAAEERVKLANEAANLGFESGRSFLHLQRVAAMFAASDLVPDAFRGNIANCSIAVNLARRLGADELMTMQNLYIVYGRPGWSSKFKIAMFNQTARYTPVSYEFFGEKGKDSYGCRAKCTYRETGELIVGPDITIALAKAEGWYDKVSKKTGERASKWPTMTDLMLRYRSASWMIDTTAPELTMGLHTVEELIDTGELLEQAIKNTEEKMEAKRRADLAVASAPTKLDALVDAAKSAEEKPEAKAQGAEPLKQAKEVLKRKAAEQKPTPVVPPPVTSPQTNAFGELLDENGEPIGDPFKREPRSED